jgi:hypothetical protein
MTTTSFTTPGRRHRITLETSDHLRFSAEDARAEDDALTEVLRRMYLSSLGVAPRGGKMAPEKRALMVQRMKATREARGITWPSGDNHWKRRQMRGEYVPRSQRG